MNDDTHDNSIVKESGYLGSKNPTITRDLSDDRLFQVSEENVNLKKHLRKQEDRIRQLATKLVRVIGDKSRRNKRDDILIEDHKNRIEELETQVTHLRGKLTVARQQLGSYTKLVPGVPRQARPKSSRSSTGTPTGKLVVPDQVTRLLIDAKSENHALKDQVKHIHERWNKTNQELINLKEQLKLKDVEHHDEILVVRSQTQTEVEQKQQKIAQNIQLIRLQRDAKRTSSWLATYEAQCRSLEANLNSSIENVSQLELQLSNVQEELKTEQSKSLNLLKQVEEGSSYANQLKEANAQISAIQNENKILKETNESLLAKSIQSCSRVQETDNKDATLNSRIDELETTLKTELKAKSELISALSQEKAKCMSFEQGIRILEQKYNTLASELSSASEDLAKANNNLAKFQQTENTLEKKIERKLCENCPLKDAELIQMQIQIGQLKGEIGKTKELLKTQISINKEYQEEIEALSAQLTNLEILHEKERKELMDIFTEKKNKMVELEKSLEELREKRSNAVPPQAFINYDSYAMPNAEVINSNTGDNEYEVPIEKQATIQVPDVLNDEPSGENPTPLRLELKENEVRIEETDESPKLTVLIKRFVPKSSNAEKMTNGLFVTWEHQDLPRQYSPIAVDGIFNCESVHQLTENFKLRKFLVHLHQAIGQSDATILAKAEIDITSNQEEVVMKEIDTEAEVGTLIYSCTLVNFEYAAELEVEANNNNNTKMLPKTKAPVPIPRKHKTSTQDLNKIEEQNLKATNLQNVQMQPGPSRRLERVESVQTVEISSISRMPKKTIRKSILRKEDKVNSRRTEKRRVRVNDKIQELQFDSESEGEVRDIEPGQAQSLLSVGQIFSNEQDTVDSTASEIFNEVSVELDSSYENNVADSSMSEKRRARRISKFPVVTNEESDDVSTTISIETEESETSKNISEIETTSEQQWSRSETEFIIEIFYAKFLSNSRVQHDSNIKKFFVEYQFLNYSQEELETEISLPKPSPGKKAVFDFRKVFLINTSEKRKLLKQWLNGRTLLRFTLVTEPSDNDTIDCEEFGYAYVSLTSILNSGNDIIKKEIPIFDAVNSNSEIGILSISVIAFKTLNSL